MLQEERKICCQVWGVYLLPLRHLTWCRGPPNPLICMLQVLREAGPQLPMKLTGALVLIHWSLSTLCATHLLPPLPPFPPRQLPRNLILLTNCEIGCLGWICRVNCPPNEQSVHYTVVEGRFSAPIPQDSRRLTFLDWQLTKEWIALCCQVRLTSSLAYKQLLLVCMWI